MLWSISWRNIWRNRIRSLVIILAVAVGLIGGIFSYAFMAGMANQGVRHAIRTHLSHIQLHHPKYPADMELQFVIANVDKVMADISSRPDVEAVTARIKTTAMVNTAEASAGVTVTGVDPEREQMVTELHEQLIAGEYLKSGDKIPAILSQKLADRLNVGIRSKIVVAVTNMRNEITYGAFVVAGIFKTHNASFDEQNIFVDITDFADLTAFAPNTASEIAVRLSDTSLTDNVARELQEAYPQLWVQTWHEISPTLKIMEQVTTQFAYYFLAVILLALVFGIINTMLMVVMERVHEIGMLMSIGMTKLRIFFMILIETVFLSAAGGVLGILLSFLMTSFFGKHGINLEAVGQGFNSLGYSAVIYPELHADFYVSIAAMVIVTAVLGAIYPAVKALRFSPAEAIRHDT